MKPVVRGLLETDLYKFTMWQALLHSPPWGHDTSGLPHVSRKVCHCTESLPICAFIVP